MILVIFGTHNQDFSRLAKAIDLYASIVDETIVVQSGFTNYPFLHVRNHFSFCSKEKLNQYLIDSELVVMQGGWGAIEEALDLGKKIVAVPRINGLEHVHNQEQLVRKLESLCCLKGCYDLDELASCVMLAKNTAFVPLKKGSAKSVLMEYFSEWFGL